MSTISISQIRTRSGQSPRSGQSGQSVRARRRAYAEVIATARIQRRRHAPRAWARGLLALSLWPHRLLPLRAGRGHWSAFWDAWNESRMLDQRLRAQMRWKRLREYARMRAALRRARRVGRCASDAQWRAMVTSLYAQLEVVIEAWEAPADPYSAPTVHFIARDVTPAYRAALTQPTLDAQLLGAHDDANALARPHDTTTQPALPAIRLL